MNVGCTDKHGYQDSFGATYPIDSSLHPFACMYFLHHVVYADIHAHLHHALWGLVL